MDGDPAVEPQLDALSLTLPLPYRVALLTVLGIWGWGANLHYLYGIKIDVPGLIRYPSRASSAQAPHYRTAYRLAATAATGVGLSLVFFWLLTRRDPSRVLAYDWLPMTTLGGLALLLLVPLPRRLQQLLRPSAASTAGGSGGGGGGNVVPLWASLPQDGRRRFAAMVRRVALGGLAEPQHGKFGDVLLADVVTSYAKVLGDVFVCVCMFFFPSSPGREASATDRPDRDCGGAVIVPLIMAAPSAARLRQCLIEYVRARRAREPGGQHLANALKYFSAFPVIVLSALQRPDGSPGDASAASLRQAWIIAVLINSLYSFYWDVTRDWDLTLLTEARDSVGQPWGLRRRLYIRPAPQIYYAVIAMDLMLRCTWSLKLSPHLGRVGAHGDFESSLFLMELLEVFRRWVWIFFRVETEWIRTTGNAALGADDLLLGDYQGKYDDEDD
ncbi:protein-er retention protein [Grosmannia clavigera kw1407]|uniref:Protein-er retention protein n=1 Tax=Grosmannia clavigera (strain kw1407 / UAMH 11150) TaxID=655863 RepID=F0XRK3_GROCL|nr:protein-er retention protein [Grosmannia clavigera kw1407]EFW99770.1 protein-er retention protein [Grosmannia clavigera kw1407]